MRTTTFYLLILTLLALPAGAQTAFNFDTTVAGVAPSGQGHMVTLANGYSVFCGPDGLLGKLCGSLTGGNDAAFTGPIPALDSDLAALGAFGADRMRIDDGIPPELFTGNGWSINGCVTKVQGSGQGLIITMGVGQVERRAFCDPMGTLGALCGSLVIGDCGVFSGSFPAPDSDLFGIALRLRSIEADETVTGGGGGGGGGGDGDGDALPVMMPAPEPTADDCERNGRNRDRCRG